MSGFIPLNQSTPVQQRYREPIRNRQRYQNYNFNHSPYTQRGSVHNNRWSNHSRSSYSSNSSNNSCGQENRTNIDAYLDPSMLQDPWESLRQKSQCNDRST
ncbi:unnamed protein product [Arctia plantaginis]|uniref:Uncharacterized protein n=1 Tax=Arctia plantaginis TaxID=874455 RepID=A0A8S1A810_ARCPL|nr:unnamed protein product [Arctia plantaginis]CAB3243268.1 unnamed protein product [Arctia plantaginis]